MLFPPSENRYITRTATKAKSIPQNRSLSLFFFLFLCLVISFLFNLYSSPPCILRFPFSVVLPFPFQYPASGAKNLFPRVRFRYRTIREIFRTTTLFFGGTLLNAVYGFYRSVSLCRISASRKSPA